LDAKEQAEFTAALTDALGQAMLRSSAGSARIEYQDDDSRFVVELGEASRVRFEDQPAESCEDRF
jgi:hypothetical protein